MTNRMEQLREEAINVVSERVFQAIYSGEATVTDIVDIVEKRITTQPREVVYCVDTYFVTLKYCKQVLDNLIRRGACTVGDMMDELRAETGLSFHMRYNAIKETIQNCKETTEEYTNYHGDYAERNVYSLR